MQRLPATPPSAAALAPAALAPAALAPVALTPIAQDLTAFNTLGLPSVAAQYVRLTDMAQLPALSRLAAQADGVWVLGGGSNVVLPARVSGLVAQVGLTGVRLLASAPDAWVVEAAAGESWHGLVRTCLENGWHGLENLALIPGTVGAAPVQNIGAYGVELRDVLWEVSAWDVARGQSVTMRADACGFGYRDSRFKHDAPGRWLITSVRLRLPRPWRPVLDYPDLRARVNTVAPTPQQVFESVCAIRRAKLPDPAELGNAGSFFKNPVVDAACYERLKARFAGLPGHAQADGRYKLSAAWLIEQCGWKGRRLGPVGMHARQALVLVNHGGACAAEVMSLAAAVQASVRARYGVPLEPEPVVIAAQA